MQGENMCYPDYFEKHRRVRGSRLGGTKAIWHHIVSRRGHIAATSERGCS